MFDLSKVYDDGFSPLPVGEYTMRVSSAEWKVSSTNNKYLNLGFKVVGEKYNGRMVFEKLNLFHTKEKVKEMATGQLQKLIIACGYATDKLTSVGENDIIELIEGKEVSTKVKIEKDSEYGDKNKITKFSKIELAPENDESIPF